MFERAMVIRVLMLTHRLPFPPDKGDKIRSFHLLRHLARHCEVHVAFPIDDAGDLAHLSEVCKLARSVMSAPITGALRKLFSMRAMISGGSISVLHFYSPDLQRQIDRLLRKDPVDIVFCFSAAMAEYVFRSPSLANRPAGTLLVMDLIDVDSAKWTQYAQHASPSVRWIYRYESMVLRRYERKIIDGFDQVFLVTNEEIRHLDACADLAKVSPLSNGVDLDYFTPMERKAPREPGDAGPTVVFTGVMDYLPNIEGISWFVCAVFPQIRQRYPHARLLIVGSKPTREILGLARFPGVEVTGRVEDVRDYLAAADVCIAPLLIARGIQNKVLEAMAMAKAVVSTSQAFTGIEAIQGRDLIVADGEHEFCEAILSLLDDPDEAALMGARARRCVEQHYAWAQKLQPLDQLLAAVKEKVQPRACACALTAGA